MSWDPTWEGVHKARGWGRYPPEELIRFVARHYFDVPDRSAVKILELGCGAGANLWFLAREGFDTFGVDGSETAIARARQYLEQQCLTAHLKVSDVTEQAELFPGVRFDAIIDVACSCCHRLNIARAMFDRAFDGLKPGGRIYSMTLAAGTYGDALGKEVEPGTRAEIPDGPFRGLGICHFFTLEEIKSVFARFDNVGIEYSVRSIRDMNQLVKLWVVEGIRSA